MGEAEEELAKRHGAGTQLQNEGKGKSLSTKVVHHQTVFSVSYNSDGLCLGWTVIQELFQREICSYFDTEQEYIFGQITRFYWLFYASLKHLLYYLEQRLENSWNAPLPFSYNLHNFGQFLCTSKGKSYLYLDIPHFTATVVEESFLHLTYTSPETNTGSHWSCESGL